MICAAADPFPSSRQPTFWSVEVPSREPVDSRVVSTELIQRNHSACVMSDGMADGNTTMDKRCADCTSTVQADAINGKPTLNNRDIKQVDDKENFQTVNGNVSSDDDVAADGVMSGKADAYSKISTPPDRVFKTVCLYTAYVTMVSANLCSLHHSCMLAPISCQS